MRLPDAHSETLLGGKAVARTISFSLALLCLPGLRAESRLVFPRLVFEENALTGVAVGNPTDSDAQVTFTAYGRSGKLLSGSNFENPVKIMVPAGQQISRRGRELFGSQPNSVAPAWFLITSPVDGITGFFLYQNRSQHMLDGADPPALSRKLVFNEVRVASGYSTELNLINPGEAEADLKLELLSSGAEPLQSGLKIPPHGVERLDTQALFGLKDLDAPAHIRVVSNVEIAGFEFVRSSSGDLYGLNARPLSELLDEIHFPQGALLAPWESVLNLINYSEETVIVTLSTLQPDGTLFGATDLENNPVTRGLPPGDMLRENLESLFGFTGQRELDGWLKVESTAPAINGFIRYGRPQAGSVAAVAALPEGRTRALLPHIATIEDFSTTVTVLNSATLAANLRIQALTMAGQSLGSFDTVLQPGQRLSGPITQLIPRADNQREGLIWIRSDLPIHTTALFGTPTVLSNIPPQAAPRSFSPPLDIPLLRVFPPLAIVRPGNSHQFSTQGQTGNVSWAVNGLEGGDAESGTVSANGLYLAPGGRPGGPLTVSAVADKQSGGASIDVLALQDLVSGLGLIQSVVHLRSLQKLYVAELAVLGAFSEDRQPLGQTLGPSGGSGVFEVAPPAQRQALLDYPDDITKMISFNGRDGQEHLLLAGKSTGKIYRLTLNSAKSEGVFEGSTQPHTIAFDPVTDNLLVAEQEGIITVPRLALEDGLRRVTDDSAETHNEKAVTLVPTDDTQGLVVDECTGDIYFSDTPGGSIRRYLRETGESTEVVTGLTRPGRMLDIYRIGVPCPASTHLLVIEQGLKISMLIPSGGLLIPWIEDPNAVDLTFLPPGSTLVETPNVLVGRLVGTEGTISRVEVLDKYREHPGNRPPLEESCLGQILFADPTLEALVQQLLELDVTSPAPCRSVSSLTSLRARGQGILSLAGLEFFTNLDTLDLSANYITDVAPLEHLENLGQIDLSHNLIEDLTPLVANAGLGAGDRLNLRTNALSQSQCANLDELKGRQIEVLTECDSDFPSSCPPLQRFHCPREADLTVTQTNWFEPILSGGTLIYRIRVSNLGPNLATGARLVDTLPGLATFRSASSSQGSCAVGPAGIVTCNLGVLGPGRSTTVVIPVAILGGPGTILFNRAAVLSVSDDLNAGNDVSLSRTVVPRTLGALSQ